MAEIYPPNQSESTIDLSPESPEGSAGEKVCDDGESQKEPSASGMALVLSGVIVMTTAR